MKKFLLPILALASVVQVSAKVIDPAHALARAQGATRSGQPLSDYKLQSTVNTDSGEAGVYLFSDGTSSLILSADDSTPAVLGILDQAIPEKIDNPQFLYWINMYASQIDWQRKNSVFATRSDDDAPKKEIKPLLTTKWDQVSPYNDRSPEVNGKKSWAGCVATAMSQVMNYHEWPAKGKGSNQYLAKAANKQLSCDFSTITFDWANMLDSYSGTSTQAQKNAIADLLYACAIGVDMNFSPDGSGAWTENVPRALVNFFDYDKALKIVYRDYYSLSDWTDLVYEELEDYGPVYYAGEGDDGAHAFVCDGYKDGYFHINWGWSGSLDGYYLLTSLFPGTQQGAGGSIGTYNFGQMIIHGVQRPREGSKMDPVILYPWGYKIEERTIPVNSSFTVNGWVMNYSTNLLKGKLGIMVEKSDDTVLTCEGVDEHANYSKVPVEGDWMFKAKLPDNLPDGEYVVYPGFLPEGEKEWIKIEPKRNFPAVYLMTVSKGYATFTPESVATVVISNSQIEGKTFRGKNVKINTKISNYSDSDYEGIIKLSVRNDKDEEVATGERRFICVDKGEKIDFRYNSRLLKDINVGTYTIGFVDAITGQWISDVMTMNYEAAPETTISIGNNDFRYNGDSNNADPSNLEFILKVNCTKGYFTDGLDLTIWTAPQSGNGVYVTTISTGDLDIEAGKSVELKLKGKIEEPIIGMRYIVGAWYNGKQYGPGIYFTVTSSGVEDIELDSVQRTDVYNMSGVKVATVDGENVDRTQLQKGIYIFRFTKSSGKVETQRIMVK